MIWIDAQLSPSIAAWITAVLGIDAKALRELGLRDSEDEEIFLAARKANATVVTKDNDFVLLLDGLGPPPKVILLTCGNTSNAALKKILSSTLSEALELLDKGESLVEIG
ncbi:MAG TPA: DUF5615 family PIN-like protein [Pyrinomonadaceae bacterium]|nr:DUF5615 family PIN-like protein [Pyrinomonadaceae bacterium]